MDLARVEMTSMRRCRQAATTKCIAVVLFDHHGDETERRQRYLGEE